MKLKHYKEIVWFNLHNDSDPNDRHIREWTNTMDYPRKFIKFLLKDMEREGSIKIEYINHKGCIKRVCTPLKNVYAEIDFT